MSALHQNNPDKYRLPKAYTDEPSPTTKHVIRDVVPLSDKYAPYASIVTARTAQRRQARMAELRQMGRKAFIGVLGFATISYLGVSLYNEKEPVKNTNTTTSIEHGMQDAKRASELTEKYVFKAQDGTYHVRPSATMNAIVRTACEDYKNRQDFADQIVALTPGITNVHELQAGMEINFPSPEEAVCVVPS